MSAYAKRKGQSKAARDRPHTGKSLPLQDAEERSDRPRERSQRTRNGHSNQHKVGHYGGPLQEVIDSAREALVVYLLTQDPFPTDEVVRNDQRDGTESEKAMKWKQMLDGFFKAALEKNADALAIGELFSDLISHSAALKEFTNSSDPQRHTIHPFCSM